MAFNDFLNLPENIAIFEKAQVVILPIPLEATVSYGHGTCNGPQAIIDASKQVELYIRELDQKPALRYGIHTLPALNLPNDAKAAINAIATATAKAASFGKLVVGLGGEHTVSVGFGRGLLQALGGPITIVQIDAHCDLRNSYEDSPYSHACVARRLLEEEGVEQVLQLGIRSLCSEEANFAHTNRERLCIWFSEDIHAGTWQTEFIQRIQGRRIYLTIDVDGLDPAIVPATGTPEPDGLTWPEALAILRTLTKHATVIGMDCVELAPVEGLHFANFAVAKLLYTAISYIKTS
jgi:agmatinase